MALGGMGAVCASRRDQGGGVAVFVRDGLTYRERPDLGIFEQGRFESVFVVIVRGGGHAVKTLWKGGRGLGHARLNVCARIPSHKCLEKILDPISDDNEQEKFSYVLLKPVWLTTVQQPLQRPFRRQT